MPFVGESPPPHFHHESPEFTVDQVEKLREGETLLFVPYSPRIARPEKKKHDVKYPSNVQAHKSSTNILLNGTAKFGYS
jgi:hypothetical protein